MKTVDLPFPCGIGATHIADPELEVMEHLAKGDGWLVFPQPPVPVHISRRLAWALALKHPLAEAHYDLMCSGHAYFCGHPIVVKPHLRLMESPA